MAKTRTQIETQIAKLEKKLAALRIELTTAGDGDYTPEVGDVVAFEYGRKDKRAMQGKVLGVKDTGKGVIVTVFVDDGANSELCKVFSTHCRKLEDEGAFEEAEVVEPAEAADPFAL